MQVRGDLAGGGGGGVGVVARRAFGVCAYGIIERERYNHDFFFSWGFGVLSCVLGCLLS